MWWTQGVTVALTTITVFGAVSMGRVRQWAAMALWLALMLGSTGWFAYGAWKLADGLNEIGSAFRDFGGGSRGSTSAAPSLPSTTPSRGEPTAPPAPRWPRRLSEFPPEPAGPVQAQVLSIREGAYGMGMEFRVRLTNSDSARAVDGVRFELWCFNNFGDLVANPQAFGEKPSFGMISQDHIAPGHPENGAWNIAFGADQCTQARSWINQVHFADGTVWESPHAPAPVGS